MKNFSRYFLPFAAFAVAVASAFAVEEGVSPSTPPTVALHPAQPSAMTLPMPESSSKDPAEVKTDTSPLIYPLNKQEYVTYEDLQSKSPADLNDPSNVTHEIEYDPDNDYYIYHTKVGNMDIATPYVLNADEYRDASLRQSMNDYWKEKNGKNVDDGNSYKINDIKIGLGTTADKIFGPGGVQLKTQGSVDMTFGLRHTVRKNPSISARNRRSTIFDFDTKIQLNATGQVGDRVKFSMNYNTEATFDFDQQLINLSYEGKEDNIIKKIEAGNVSMPLSTQLISGTSSLFGVRTDMQFGKLKVSAIAAQQESERKTVSTEGGAQTTAFELSASDYESNRHFFLSQFFRENYDEWMKKIPTVTSGVVINKVQIWVTNTSTNSSYTTRNIIGFTSLGEDATRPDKVNPANATNSLYSTITSSANSGIRTYGSNIIENISYNGANLVNGTDYEIVNSARLLSSDEYTLNPYLGFISLKSTLNASDVLAVSYQYTYRGQTYKVGEFTSDRVSSDSSSACLFVKLLKSTSSSPDNALLWKLMMKNVYSLSAYNVSSTKFKLDVQYYYSNDSISSYLSYLPISNIKNKPLIKVLNCDRLNSKNKAVSDGYFDFVDGYTVDATNGRVYFPSVEPFGSYLESKITDKSLATQYSFPELYSLTQTEAKEYTEKDKFLIKGEFRSSSGSQIRLGATNVPRGSVRVTAGGRTLVENEGYTVDYNLGVVTILDESALSSNASINVSLESESYFNTQRKTLLGTNLEYDFNEHFSFGGTVMHLGEKPLTEKVSYGSEPISNTIWGLNAAYNTQSQWLTNLVDKLPLIDAKNPSSFAISGEFAQLVPGHASAVDDGGNGVSYIDDFEGTSSSINILSPTAWMLASTPVVSDATYVGHRFIRTADSFWGSSMSTSLGDLGYGLNRAQFAWYSIDQVLNNPTSDTPRHLRNDNDQLSNHFVRLVHEQEIYQNREAYYGQSTLLTTLSLAYYPQERGPYNLDVSGLNADGTLDDPSSRWGGIMRKLDNTDFVNSNVEYIEFWLMDPFVYDDMNTSSGKLVFNLGEVSEDVLHDGRMAFENGMPTSGTASVVDSTIWGRVPRIQASTYAFDVDHLEEQDLGLNGLSDEMEMNYSLSYKKYLEAVQNKLSAVGYEKFQSQVFSPLTDPAGDDFHHYLGSDYNDAQMSILNRYKYYNGMENNSSSSGSSYSASSNYPNVEDLNSDHTLNQKEQYFEYVVDIDKNVLQNESRWAEDHIASRVDASVSLKNGTTGKVSWYQFKIPIDEYNRKEGSISNFQSIRFIRMYMTGFESETYLRFGALDLVRTDWRVYSQNKNLFDNNDASSTVGKGSIAVSSVNIEDDAAKLPVNYCLPPGVSRVIDPSQTQVRQENEQSMLLKVDSLGSKQARAVYKSTTLDTRQYKRLKMFVHCENRLNENPVGDNHLYLFFRMGSDFTQNYYEYQIPLKVTADGATAKTDVWPSDNEIDFAFSLFTNLKLRRDRYKAAGQAHVNERYTEMDGDNLISIIGNPSFGEVSSMMIGVRNEDGTMHSADVWVNELRMVGFNEDGGNAALVNAGLVLSDIASLSAGGRYEQAGFGSVEDDVSSRRTDDYYEYNFSAAMQMGKLFPEKAKVNMPITYTFTKNVSKPKYDPLNSDLTLDETLDNQANEHDRDSVRDMSQTSTTYRSITITNVRVGIQSSKPMPYDPANFSFSLGYNETKKKDPETVYDNTYNYNGTVNYNYTLNPKPVEPLKKVKFLKNKNFAFFRDFNFYYLPKSISLSSTMQRYYNEVLTRDFTASYVADTSFPYMSWDKDFTWSRSSDVKWNLTRNVKLNFASVMNASIDEVIRDENGYYRDVPVNKDYLYEVGERDWYDRWKDTVWASIHHFGTPVEYYQRFSANWTLPINKLPYLGWINSTFQYSADYTWDRGAETELGQDPETGNYAISKRSWVGDVRFNLEKLYNQIPYLKGVNDRFSQTGKRNAQKKKEAEEKRRAQLEEKAKKEGKDPDELAKAEQIKTYERKNIRLQKDKDTRIAHRMGTTKVKVVLTDADGKVYPVKFKVIDGNVIVLKGTENVSRLSLSITGSIKPRSSANTALDGVVRALMMVRNVSATYRQDDALSLYGYSPTSGFLGQDQSAPGYDFTFGFYNTADFIEKAREKDWLIQDSDLVTTPIVKTREQNFQVKASLVPLQGIRIDLNAAWMRTRTDDYYYMYENSNTFNGSYSKTHIAIGTAFKGKSLNSEQFNDFMNYRYKVRSRVKNKMANATGITDEGEYQDKLSLNSSDVLVPAFYSAYSGFSASSAPLELLQSVMSILPNWKVQVDLLEPFDNLKSYLSALNLNHAYKCTYNINSYSSLTDWESLGGGYGEVAGTSAELDNGYFSSEYSVDNANITESFSPLIGIDATLKNSLSLKFELKKSRTDGLDVQALQVVESYSNEYVFGTGYRIDDFGAMVHLNNGKQKSISNDLNLRFDLTYKNTDAYIRKIEDNYSQLSNGITSFIIRFSADYVFSKRLNFRFYYDRTASTPKVSSSYPTVTSDFGFGLKLLLSK